MARGTVTESNGTGMVGAIRSLSTFRALRSANFRLLWAGMLGNSMSLWMEQVARSWLVWQLTGSGLALGLVNFFRAIPFLIFGVVGGVAADRLDKRRLLLVTQSITMSLHFLMAVLIFSGVIQLWQVYLTAFLAGTSMSFEQPNRQSLIPQLVEPDELMNAVALNTMVRNGSRIVGPAVAGVLIAIVGMGGVYLLQGLAYLGVVSMTWMLKVPPRPERDRAQSVLADLKEGLTFMGRNPTVLGLMIVALVPMVFGMPYTTILPVFADRILGMDASGLGLLFSSTGLGALAGSIAIATLGSLKRRGRILLTALFLFGFSLVALSFSNWLYLSMLFVAGVGIANTSYMAINNTTLLELTPPALQGRVMAVYLLDRGLTPLGAVLAGVMTDTLGAPLALSFMGAVCVVLAVGMAIAVPQVRRID